MIILDIVIQFGKFFSEGGGNDNNWLDNFLKYFFAPFISFLSALALYYWKESVDKRKEEAKKKKDKNSDFKYFTTVMEEILIDIPRQIEGYKKYSEAIKNEPWNTHMLSVVSSENLNRIANKFDQQKMFHSYIAQFDEKQNDEAIKRFMKLYKNIDVYLIIYNDAININKRLNDEVSNNLNNNYIQIFRDKIAPNFDKLYNDLSPSTLPLFKLLEDIKNDFSKRIDRSPKISQEFFVKKLMEEYDLLKDYELGRSIFNDCRVVASIYSDTIKHSNNMSAEINRLVIQLEGIMDEVSTILKANQNLKK